MLQKDRSRATDVSGANGTGGFNVSQANPGLVPGYPVNPLGSGDDVGGEFVFQFAVVVGNGFNRSICSSVSQKRLLIVTPISSGA
jgi:hypothetical protein